MKNWFNFLLSEPDNKTPCPVRLIAFLGALLGLGLVGYDVIILKAHFDLQSFGIGYGALLGAFGAALGMKKDSPTETK